MLLYKTTPGLTLNCCPKQTAGQVGLALAENFDTKHAGFSVENKAQNREILRLFCNGTEQELRDMSAVLLRIYFVVYGFKLQK